jgi:hypothetical protein
VLTQEPEAPRGGADQPQSLSVAEMLVVTEIRSTTASSSLQGYTEAKAVAIKAGGIVEVMRFRPLEPARQHHFVAAGIPALPHCVFHHRPANSFSLMVRGYGYIFNNSGLLPALGEIVHDQELIGGYNRLIDFHDIDGVRGVSTKYFKMQKGFFEAERTVRLDSRRAVKLQDRLDILSDRFSNRHCSHAVRIALP